MITQQVIDQIDEFKLTHVWNESWSWYMFDSKSKHYHNLRHASEVVERLFVLTPEPSVQLLLAAKWHDAVYVPMAGADANERCSAAAMNVAYQIARKKIANPEGSDKIILEAQKLILGTTVANHLMGQGVVNGYFWDREAELAILLDADLGSLADPYDAFLKRQADIIKENFGTVEEHSKNSAQFLVRFLQVRENIYHTDKARELWEEKARANIRQYAEANDVKV